MAEFPQAEAKIIELANKMMSGFAAPNTPFPEPPIPVIAPTPGIPSLQTDMEAWNLKRNARVEKEAEAGHLKSEEDALFQTLQEHMKTDLRYAENLPNISADDWHLIGWGPRKAPTAQGVPGQPRMFEVSGASGFTLHVKWKKPTEGGKVSAYRVLKRVSDTTGDWIQAAFVGGDTLEATLSLESSKWDLTVVAFNNHGESVEANTVKVSV